MRDRVGRSRSRPGFQYSYLSANAVSISRDSVVFAHVGVGAKNEQGRSAVIQFFTVGDAASVALAMATLAASPTRSDVYPIVGGCVEFSLNKGTFMYSRAHSFM